MRKPSARFELRSVWRRRVPVDGLRIACGNRLWSAANVATNEYAANCLKQYTFILRASAPLREITHDADGNMTGDGTFAYAYDAENRLVSTCPVAPSNGALAVENCYDHKHRRIRKIVKNFDGEAWHVARTHIFV